MTENLIKEQEEHISAGIDKWIKIHISTTAYSDEDIIDSVNDYYLSINKLKPKKIIILDSHERCIEYIKENRINIGCCINRSISNRIYLFIMDHLFSYIHKSAKYSIGTSRVYFTYNAIKNSVNKFNYDYAEYYVIDTIHHNQYYGIFLDYGINILKIKELEQYKPLLGLLEKVYYVTLQDDIAIISRKLKSIHLDDNDRLHGDGVKAFEFNDGYGSYFNHGTPIPEQYGSVKIEDWKAEWLLTEKNTEYKRLLIREIGYNKITKELKSKIIHKQDNMELLEINDIDIEPMRLLKVECPSTNSIYLLRVPPNIDKCEECRQWTLFNENDDYEFVRES